MISSTHNWLYKLKKNTELSKKYSSFLRIPSISVIAVLALWALFGLEDDQKHASLVAILFVHVPAAWGALACFTVMAISSACGIIYRSWLLLCVGKTFAYPGLLFSILSIITGMLWGKPAWGAFWVWDARLVSMALLTILYGIYFHFATRHETMVTAGIVAILGWLNIPIIKGSVYWWNTLHQKESVSLWRTNAIDYYYLIPLIIMTLAWIAYTFSWCLRAFPKVSEKS